MCFNFRAKKKKKAVNYELTEMTMQRFALQNLSFTKRWNTVYHKEIDNEHIAQMKYQLNKAFSHNWLIELSNWLTGTLIGQLWELVDQLGISTNQLEILNILTKARWQENIPDSFSTIRMYSATLTISVFKKITD